MLYSHDTLGLGHVRRTIAIARAVLAGHADLSALLVTCSPLIDSLPMPPGLDYMKLPSACKAGPGDYQPRTLGVEPERFRGLRAGALRETCVAFSPDLLLVDKSPLGLMGELAGALTALRSQEHVHTVVGWRDILDSPECVRDEWRRQRTLAVIDRNYDEVWVYGDPAVYDIRERYGMPDRVAERVHHLGYLAPRTTARERARVRDVMGVNGAPLAVVTVGGGEGGERVLEAYCEAARARLLPADLHTLMVTGPFMPESARRRISSCAPHGIQVTDFLAGLEYIIAAADVVIGRAGYNTVCEALGSGTPTLLVPRVLHRDEQSIRARRLAQLGLADVLEEPDLTPDALARAMRRLLARGRAQAPAVKLDGLEEVTRRVMALLPGAAGSPASEPAGNGFARIAGPQYQNGHRDLPGIWNSPSAHTLDAG